MTELACYSHVYRCLYYGVCGSGGAYLLIVTGQFWHPVSDNTVTRSSVSLYFLASIVA
jgi:hypothetical protein